MDQHEQKQQQQQHQPKKKPTDEVDSTNTEESNRNWTDVVGRPTSTSASTTPQKLFLEGTSLSSPLNTSWSPHKMKLEDRRSSSGKRKISESRGVKLPDLKIPDRRQSEELNNSTSIDTTSSTEHGVDNPQANSTHYMTVNEDPPPTASPLGHVLRHRRQQSTSGSGTSPDRISKSILDICIFLPDHRGIQFSIEGGRLATAGVLTEMVREHLGLESELTQQVFALWMISPYLEIQLKPHHIPFQVRKYWPELLRKFTTKVDKEAAVSDEPILTFRRNVLLGGRTEKQLCSNNEKATEILFTDARECILTGKYPCDIKDVLNLAALDMALTWGPYNSSQHTNSFIRDSLEDFVPEHLLGTLRSWSLFGWSVIGCKGEEERILHNYRSLSLRDPNSLRMEYLDFCRKLPFYGAAFFSGQVERPPVSKTKKHKLRLKTHHSDLQVQIAINRDYFTVIDPHKHTVLLVESIWDCAWRKIQTPNPADPDSLPSFFLHFPDPEVPESNYVNLGQSDGSNNLGQSDGSNNLGQSDGSNNLGQSEGNNNLGQLEGSNEPLEEEEVPVGNSKLLQIFSWQAVMMEALLNSCVEMDLVEDEEFELNMVAERENDFAMDETDHMLASQTTDDRIDISDGSKLVELPSSPVLSNKLGKLCLATFNPKGECIDCVGSLQSVLKD